MILDEHYRILETKKSANFSSSLSTEFQLDLRLTLTKKFFFIN